MPDLLPNLADSHIRSVIIRVCEIAIGVCAPYAWWSNRGIHGEGSFFMLAANLAMLGVLICFGS